MALALGEDHDLAVASVIAPKGGAEGEERRGGSCDAEAEDDTEGEGDSEE